MPDLNGLAVTGWLRERDPNAAVLPIIGPIDSDPAVLQQMLELGKLLDTQLALDARRLSERLTHSATAVDLRAAITQVGPARRMRLLSWLAEAGLPDDDALLARLTGPGAAGDFIRAELQALQRRALLASIFAPERIQALLNACQPPSTAGASG